MTCCPCLPRINVAEMRQKSFGQLPQPGRLVAKLDHLQHERATQEALSFERSAPLVSVGCVACLSRIVERQGQRVSTERCAIAASYVRASGDGSKAAAGLLLASHEHATCPYGRLVPSEVEVIPLSPSLIRKPRL